MLVAQTTAPANQPPPPSMTSLLYLFVPMFLVMYLLVMRPQRRERDKHQKMLAALKKNDRVMTIGGLFGVVQGVKGDEVTLKVDETTNTKLTFSRSAIKTVVASAGETSESKPG
ncbi:MAG: preprotein translocase subunit YajC [Phycisphaerae bacterium]